MQLADHIKDEIIKDVRLRLYDECMPRIKQCISAISDEQIWHKPNQNSNSIGNLVLHVCGNIRQYVMSGIGGQPDVRARSTEFAQSRPLPKQELYELMDLLLKDIDTVLSSINADNLTTIKQVQGFDMSVTSILIHITEHLSYHTGQIAYATKLIEDIDLRFYGDMDLDVRSV